MSSLQLHQSLAPLLYKPRFLSHLPYPTLRFRSLPVASLSKNGISMSQSHENGVVQNGAQEEYSDSLPEGLLRELMPTHVAVIMDGNRRWARMRGLPIWSGYEAGVRALRRLVELCCKWGIKVLTVFAFSSDNWFRPKVETDFLMGLFERGLRDELENFSKPLQLLLLNFYEERIPPLQLLDKINELLHQMAQSCVKSHMNKSISNPIPIAP